MKRAGILGWSTAALLSVSCSGGGATSTHADGGVDATKPVDAGRPKGPNPKDARADRAADGGPALNPGEYCVGGTPTIRFDPPQVVVASGQTRPVQAIVEPDLCSPVPISFTSSDSAAAAPPAGATLDIRHPTYSFMVTGGPLTGGATSETATLTATIPGPNGGPGGTATLPVVVNNGALPSCSPADVASGQLSLSSYSQSGTGGVAAASIAVPPGECDVSPDAANPVQTSCTQSSQCAGTDCISAFTRTDEFALPPFTATVACANDDLTVAKPGAAGHPAAPGSLVSIGPAVTFTAGSPINMTQSLRRELDFTIPVNPAAIPTYGRIRHIQVLFMSPASKGLAATPRILTIANPQITQTSSGAFVFQFSAPWFGTYQAAFSPDAGTVTRTRHVTHRAVVGFSMGASGAGSFGFRHHDQFDMVGPLGGPSDWTWLFWYIEQYYLGGFCPETNADGTPNKAYPNCPTYAPNLWPFHETYAHTCDYNHWFFQYGGGTGGHFSRSSFSQIFDDLSLMHGNPNGQSYDPNNPDASTALSFFPAGPTSISPWIVGDAGGLPGTCALAVNPISPDPNDADPSLAIQNQWQNQCTASRCLPSNAWSSPKPYYDARYNPKGEYPVISYCETGLQDPAATPYEDVWSAPQPGNDYPLDVALAVDLNKNGMRDENEPVLHQGHEPWGDVGVDGLADPDEPGYDPVNNPDPNQDDYDFQLNPNGTEGDHRYQMGEPFQDYGLDGVPNTPQLSAGGYDFGEGDGVFTTTIGLASFYQDDPHSILHQWSTAIPAGQLTDTALLRLNVWADGGVRDMVNFESCANHLIGSVASRTVAAGATDAGTQLRTTAFYNGFDRLPGQTPGEANFDINQMRWSEVVDASHVRYGTLDASPLMVAQGDGQHVGTGQQLLDRLQTAIYAADQMIWTDADRTLTDTVEGEVTGDAGNATTGLDAGALLSSCIGQLCTFPFAADNRVGPVYVTLPPGYTLPQNVTRNIRYPVIYALHGYGQTPDGLAAAALVSTNYMNDPARSSATRLGKAILVYVDGRCRFSSDDPAQPECIQGSFYLNSNRPDLAHPGTNVAQFDQWFDDLVAYIDANFRTMPAEDLTVTE